MKDFHAAGAVHKKICSSGYGPSLPALRASTDANSSWVMDPCRKKEIVIQEGDDFEFSPGGRTMVWCWSLIVAREFE